MRRHGEVSEWLKEQHWKCCSGLKPARGFESRPLRFVEVHAGFTGVLALAACTGYVGLEVADDSAFSPPTSTSARCSRRSSESGIIMSACSTPSTVTRV